MIPMKDSDNQQPVQRKNTLETFPFDEPEIAKALAHAIAVLLRNNTPVPADEDNTEEDSPS